jgi:NadR type nicotinamide-nucleotide adenylyltransferase
MRVAITGPESTGKSTLASALADHYNTSWVPEYARDYLNKLNRPYTYEDVEKIAIGQIELEDKLASTAIKVLFCDTELIVIKIWLEYKYNKVPDWIEEEIKKRQYDLILLCDIDIPWEPDPLRENPDLRKFFFDWFVKEIKANQFKYIVISGSEKQRLESAIIAIDQIIPKTI